jgi:hypothetical protein
MLVRKASANPVELSYHTMRRMVGLLALALPVTLAAGTILAALLIHGHLPHPLLQRSISDYYYTPMRDFYVGCLCVIAAFLACARGCDLHEAVTGYMAGVCALGVACFPAFNPRSGRYTHGDLVLGVIHNVFAALMYLTLSYICIFLFHKSSRAQLITRHQRERNRIYAASGLVMVACMIAMTSLTIQANIARHHPSHLLFWCESCALCSFGIAWLTRGEGFMRDKRHMVSHSAERERKVASF